MTCLELEFRMTDAISSDGENSRVLIWNGIVTNTEARPCGDGVSWTGAVSELGTICNPDTAIEVWVGSGMVPGVVVCGNTGSVEIALGKSYTDPGFASAVGN